MNKSSQIVDMTQAFSESIESSEVTLKSLDASLDSVKNYPQATSSAVGACSNYKLISAATTNATNIKNTAGRIYSFTIGNNTNVIKYFKLYDKSSVPTVGTDTPIAVYPVQPNQTLCKEFPNVGLYFSNGISFGVTGYNNGAGIADNDTTAVAANDLAININFK